MSQDFGVTDPHKSSLHSGFSVIRHNPQLSQGNSIAVAARTQFGDHITRSSSAGRISAPGSPLFGDGDCTTPPLNRTAHVAETAHVSPPFASNHPTSHVREPLATAPDATRRESRSLASPVSDVLEPGLSEATVGSRCGSAETGFPSPSKELSLDFPRNSGRSSNLCTIDEETSDLINPIGSSEACGADNFSSAHGLAAVPDEPFLGTLAQPPRSQQASRGLFSNMHPSLGSAMRGALREQAPIVPPVVTPPPLMDPSDGIPTTAVEDSHLSSRLSSQEHAGTSPVEVTGFWRKPVRLTLSGASAVVLMTPLLGPQQLGGAKTCWAKLSARDGTDRRAGTRERQEAGKTTT